MPRVGRYFVDFEFWTASDQLYWFPLCLRAENQAQAENYAARIKAGLQANYQVVHESTVVPVISGLNSDSIAQYRQSRAIGIPTVLNMNLWTMKSAEASGQVDFAAATGTEIEKLLPDFELPATLATGELRHFTVNLIGAERAPQDEFLLINVVGPPD
jgi:hypothetical protein